MTLARVYGGGAWVMNPCCVAYESFDKQDRNGEGEEGRKGGREGGREGGGPRVWSAVAYTTVGRHLIAGEERMRVIWYPRGRGRKGGREGGGEDEVWFEIVSVARGNGWVGRLLFPSTQRMQRHFFQEQLRGMQYMVNT